MERGGRAFLVGERVETGRQVQAPRHMATAQFGSRDPSAFYRPTETLTPAKCIFSAQPCARNTVVIERAQLYLPGSSGADRPIPTRCQTKMGRVGMGEAGGGLLT